MSTVKHILDPLWITKGPEDIDVEYLKYIILAANKKWRERLENNNTSSFYEIIFHMLNLNNLAVEGILFDFNMNPIWNNDKLKKIRSSLREIYNIPENITDVFRNTNYLFINLLLDYLKAILKNQKNSKVYFVNNKIQNEKDIFIVLNKEKELTYQVWKLRFDKRFKFNHKLQRCKDIVIDELREKVLEDTIKKMNDLVLNKMDPLKNVVFTICQTDFDGYKLAEAMTFAIIFNKGIIKDIEFKPNILYELFELLYHEKVLPFTMKTWI